jgi:hypothetical protein
MGVDGSKVKARYTYFYVKGPDSKWKILHHHSSIMPERIAIAQPISENEGSCVCLCVCVSRK